MASLWDLVVAEATTNLCTNPSFETVTTGWSAGTNWSIARDTTTAKFGVASLKATASASAAVTAAQHSITLPTTNTTYYLSCWVYVPSTWDGGNISIWAGSFTSATTTAQSQYVDGTTAQDEWVYLETQLDVVTDVAGLVTLLTSSAPSSTVFFYVDGVQIEEKSYATTYCDGDQDGCEWTAGEHVSTSTRSARSWQGGRVRNLTDDLSVHINGWVGTGAPQLDTNIGELGLSSGGHHQSSRYRTRNWQLLCQINGSSQANMHSLKRTFLSKLDPRRLGEVAGRGTPVRFRYTGSSETVYIDAFYTGGAEFTGQAGFTDIFPIRLASPDPFFRTLGDKAKVLDAQDSATFNVVFRRGFGSADTGQWDVMGPITDSTVNPGFNGAAREADGTIWLGGNLTDMQSDTAFDYLANYDPVAGTYSKPYTTAPDNQVNDIAVHPDGTVYVGGSFANIDGGAAANIASYNGSTWSALGSGTNGGVTRIKIGPDGLVYVGGAFTTAGGTNVYGIATWDGSAWASVGSPAAWTATTVHDFDWDPSGNLYIVGAFTNFNGNANLDYIAKYNGSSWGTVTSSLFNSDIYSIAFDGTGNFYVGGNFTTFGGNTMSYAAYFNGTTFVPLSTGFDQLVNEIAYIPETGQLWLVGSFTQAGSNTLSDRMVIWDGSSFQHVDLDLAGSSQLSMVRRLGNYIYVSGIIDSVSGTYAGSTTVTNNGNTLAHPALHISRSGGTTATMDSIKNVTTGATLLFDYDFLDGETVTIDLRPGRRKMTSSVYGERWKIFPTSDIANFALAPGDNTITSFFRTTGSPTMTIWAEWQQTQLGAD